jgi:hypothetical protein
MSEEGRNYATSFSGVKYPGQSPGGQLNPFHALVFSAFRCQHVWNGVVSGIHEIAFSSYSYALCRYKHDVVIKIRDGRENRSG